MCKREPSAQARLDAQLSQISRAMTAEPVENEYGMVVGASPLVDDFAVLSGRPSGAKPTGLEVPWNFEAQSEDEEDEATRRFQDGSKPIGRQR